MTNASHARNAVVICSAVRQRRQPPPQKKQGPAREAAARTAAVATISEPAEAAVLKKFGAKLRLDDRQHVVAADLAGCEITAADLKNLSALRDLKVLKLDKCRRRRRARRDRALGAS